MGFKWLYELFNNDCIVLAIIVVIVLAFLWVSRQGKPSKKSDNEGFGESIDEDYVVCASPECVRCHRYDTIRVDAPVRLRAVAGQSSWNGLERIQRSFEVDTAELYNFNKQQRPNVFHLPDIAAIPWWPSTRFPEATKILENNFETILSEFLNIFNSLKHWNPNSLDDLDPIQMGWLVNDTPTGCWCVFHLYNQGAKMERSCALCPRTADLLETMPGFMHSSVFGNASFSVVYPQTVITEHYGPCNIRIRCHLGLQTPNHCSLTVADQSHDWETGRCLFFDDSFLHSVENLSDPHCTPRVVFMLDLWHPDLTEREKEALSTVFSNSPLEIVNPGQS